MVVANAIIISLILHSAPFTDAAIEDPDYEVGTIDNPLILGDFMYVFESDSECQLYSRLDYNISTDYLVIPSIIEYEGNSYTVVGIGAGALSSCPNLVQVTFPSTIEWMFGIEDCQNLVTMIFEGGCPMIYSYFGLGHEVYVTTPSWNPETALADVADNGTEFVWANPPPDLAFESDPILNGILVWVGTKIST